MSLNQKSMNFIKLATDKYGFQATVNRDDIQKLVNEAGVSYPHWLVCNREYRADRGHYKIPSQLLSKVDNGDARGAVEVEREVPIHDNKHDTTQETMQVNQVLQFRQPVLIDESAPGIPENFVNYVPFGFYKDLKQVIKSKKFYPVFITGMSGNGKTLGVEQACHELQRELIRVNISIETDKSDLLGGPTLINGNVMNRDGPVIIAMKRGAILLIDECDRGSNKLMCIQGIMEGKPYYNEKNGELVYPKPGFNIIATANTKGKGSDEGRYLSQILDDAFLERFAITVEQEYPDVKTEVKILSPLIDNAEFVNNLTQWADVIRKTFQEGAVDEVISTRRLVHIAEAFNIFKDKMKAIELCINRFDDDVKTSFLDLYTKIDSKVELTANTTTEIPTDPMQTA